MPVVLLTTLLRRLPDELWYEAPSLAADVSITRLCLDSRAVEPGDLFFALPGRRHDGARFVTEAWRRGAVAVVVEGPAAVAAHPAPLLRVHSARRTLALVAALFHGEPSQRLRLTGITGTDGKTSTAWFVHHLLAAAGRKTVALGTLGVVDESGRVGSWDGPARGPAEPARLWRPTTPEAPLFQEMLARLGERGIEDVVAEVSSHALDQERVYGSQFAVVALTHLSVDHLDFHGNAQAYRAAKARLFHRATRGGPLERRAPCAVLNIDDALGAELSAACAPAERVTYGRDPHAQVRRLQGRAGPRGIEMRLAFAGESIEMRTPVTGGFHIENLHAAAAIAYALGLSPAAIAAALPTLAPVPGRFERIDAGQPFTVIVDYAHTSDGLQRLLEAVRGLGLARIVLVFGCGGDRDRDKRGPMGEVAGRLAERVIVTSDNPRSEDAGTIAAAVAAGVARVGASCVIELDRAKALALGAAEAHPGDALVAAGKGAETMQIFADHVVPFDDRETLRRLLGGRTHGTAGNVPAEPRQGR